MPELKKAIANRRKREKDRRIQEILRAAKKIFFAKGYSRATMDEIALEAEISKPTIYQYFNTKDDLFFSLMIPFLDDLGDQIEEIAAKLKAGEYPSGADLVHDVFSLYYGFFEQDTDFFMFFTVFQQIGMIEELNEKTRDSIIEKGRRCFSAGRDMVGNAISKGLFRDIDTYNLTDFVWGSFWGIVQLEQVKQRNSEISVNLKPTLQLVEEAVIRLIVVR